MHIVLWRLGQQHVTWVTALMGEQLMLSLQVRCMVSVLQLVGQGLEQPSVVGRLLDVAATPCKPVYALASEAPLILYACNFPALVWNRPPQAHEATRQHFRRIADDCLVQARAAHPLGAPYLTRTVL